MRNEEWPLVRGEEGVTATVRGPAGLAAAGPLTLTLIDDEGPPTVTLSFGDYWRYTREYQGGWQCSHRASDRGVVGTQEWRRR